MTHIEPHKGLKQEHIIKPTLKVFRKSIRARITLKIFS